jgi:hypothetical protein
MLWLCVSVACGTLAGQSHPTAEQLTRRASFDLDCAEGNLRYTGIDSKTQGVAGCGKRATYVEQCTKLGQYSDTQCTWLLNGVIETSAAPAAAAAPAAPAASN